MWQQSTLLTKRQLALLMAALLGWMLFAAFRVPAEPCYDLANDQPYAPFALLYGKLGYDPTTC